MWKEVAQLCLVPCHYYGFSQGAFLSILMESKTFACCHSQHDVTTLLNLHNANKQKKNNPRVLLIWFEGSDLWDNLITLEGRRTTFRMIYGWCLLLACFYTHLEITVEITMQLWKINWSKHLGKQGRNKKKRPCEIKGCSPPLQLKTTSISMLNSRSFGRTCLWCRCSITKNELIL